MKLIATAVFALFVGVATVGVINTPVSAAENKNDNKNSQAEQEATYKYVAQEGDSYSLIARKAVQTYGKKFKVELSLGQVLYAETHLTQAASSPQLEKGQKVSIKEADIKAWVDKAQKLSTADKEAWMAYAQFADFNTDHVGQS